MIRRLFYRGRHRLGSDSVLVTEVQTRLRREEGIRWAQSVEGAPYVYGGQWAGLGALV